MNLQQTVSQIIGHHVSEETAIKFANEQFGTLCSFIKGGLKNKSQHLIDTLNEQLTEDALENESIAEAINYLKTEL
jgi:hypothetical protein